MRVLCHDKTGSFCRYCGWSGVFDASGMGASPTGDCMSQKELFQDIGRCTSRLLGISGANDNGHLVEGCKKRGLCRCPEPLTLVYYTHFGGLEPTEG